MKIEEKIDIYLVEQPHSLTGGDKIFRTQYKYIKKFPYWKHLDFPNKHPDSIKFMPSDELIVYDDGGVDDLSGEEVFSPDYDEGEVTDQWIMFLNKLAKKSGGWKRI